MNFILDWIDKIGRRKPPVPASFPDDPLPEQFFRVNLPNAEPKYLRTVGPDQQSEALAIAQQRGLNIEPVYLIGFDDVDSITGKRASRIVAANNDAELAEAVLRIKQRGVDEKSIRLPRGVDLNDVLYNPKHPAGREYARLLGVLKPEDEASPATSAAEVKAQIETPKDRVDLLPSGHVPTLPGTGTPKPKSAIAVDAQNEINAANPPEPPAVKDLDAQWRNALERGTSFVDRPAFEQRKPISPMQRLKMMLGVQAEGLAKGVSQLPEGVAATAMTAGSMGLGAAGQLAGSESVMEAEGALRGATKAVRQHARTGIREPSPLLKGILEADYDSLDPWQKIARAAYSSGMSLPPMLLGVLMKKPNVGAAILSAIESSEEYENARAAGRSPLSATAITLASGTGTYLLEKAGLDALAGRNPAVRDMIEKVGYDPIIKAALAYGTQGGQEFVQTVYQNLVAKGYDKDRKAFDNAIESLHSGGLFGAGVSMAQSGVEGIGNRRLRKDLYAGFEEELDRQFSELTPTDVPRGTNKAGSDADVAVWEAKRALEDAFELNDAAAAREAIRKRKIADAQSAFDEELADVVGAQIHDRKKAELILSSGKRLLDRINAAGPVERDGGEVSRKGDTIELTMRRGENVVDEATYARSRIAEELGKLNLTASERAELLDRAKQMLGIGGQASDAEATRRYPAKPVVQAVETFLSRRTDEELAEMRRAASGVAGSRDATPQQRLEANESIRQIDEEITRRYPKPEPEIIEPRPNLKAEREAIRSAEELQVLAAGRSQESGDAQSTAERSDQDQAQREYGMADEDYIDSIQQRIAALEGQIAGAESLAERLKLAGQIGQLESEIARVKKGEPVTRRAENNKPTTLGYVQSLRSRLSELNSRIATTQDPTARLNLVLEAAKIERELGLASEPESIHNKRERIESENPNPNQTDLSPNAGPIVGSPAQEQATERITPTVAPSEAVGPVEPQQAAPVEPIQQANEDANKAESVKSRNDKIAELMPVAEDLVQAQVKRFAATDGNRYEDDYRAAAMDALVRAVESYDETKSGGITLEMYARNLVKNAILSVGRKVGKKTGKDVSLNAPVGKEEGVERQELTASDSATPAEEAERNEKQSVTERAERAAQAFMDSLTDENDKIILRGYIDGEDLRETAEKTKKSKAKSYSYEYVRKRQAELLKQMRDYVAGELGKQESASTPENPSQSETVADANAYNQRAAVDAAIERVRQRFPDVVFEIESIDGTKPLYPQLIELLKRIGNTEDEAKAKAERHAKGFAKDIGKPNEWKTITASGAMRGANVVFDAVAKRMTIWLVANPSGGEMAAGVDTVIHEIAEAFSSWQMENKPSVREMVKNNRSIWRKWLEGKRDAGKTDADREEIEGLLLEDDAMDDQEWLSRRFEDYHLGKWYGVSPSASSGLASLARQFSRWAKDFVRSLYARVRLFSQMAQEGVFGKDFMDFLESFGRDAQIETGPAKLPDKAQPSQRGKDIGFQRVSPQQLAAAPERKIERVEREQGAGFIRRSVRAAIMGLDARLKSIGGNRLRAILQDLADTESEYETRYGAVVEDFEKAVAKITNEKTYNQLDYALSNRAWGTAEDIFRDNGLDPDVLVRVKAVLEDLHARADAMGLDIGYIEDYFPRLVRNYKEYLKHLTGLANEIGDIDVAVRQFQSKHGRLPSPYELADLVRQEIQRTWRKGVTLPSYFKKRTIENVDYETLKFYEPFERTLRNYMLDMNRAVSRREWLNKHSKAVERMTRNEYGGLVPSYRQIIRDLRAARLTLDAMRQNPGRFTLADVMAQEAVVEQLKLMAQPINGVAHIVGEMVQSGELPSEKQKDAIEALQEALTPEKRSQFLDNIRAIGNALGLGQFITMVRNIGDMSLAFVHSEFGPSLRALFGGGPITWKQLGIERMNYDVETNASKVPSAIQSAYLTLGGTRTITRYGQRVLANARLLEIRKWLRQIQRGNTWAEKKLRVLAEKTFVEGLTPELIAELLDPQLTRAHWKLARTAVRLGQPTDTYAMPKVYREHPFLRFMYQWRNWLFRNYTEMYVDGYLEMKKAVAEKDAARFKIGAKTFITMLPVTWAGQVILSSIVNSLMGRDDELEEVMDQEFWNLLFFNRYLQYLVQEGRYIEAIATSIVPSASLIGTISRDAMRVKQEGMPPSIWGFSLSRNVVPGVGRIIESNVPEGSGQRRRDTNPVGYRKLRERLEKNRIPEKIVPEMRELSAMRREIIEDRRAAWDFDRARNMGDQFRAKSQRINERYDEARIERLRQKAEQMRQMEELKRERERERYYYAQ